ncbi:alpha/beta fold hydrolase [Sporosarcina pasteurii]|uniref:Phospholipase ytpA n=1 Tax=Sporosarcina pasteurii TaxID=1474 RepID=A0A380C7X2_SPOPA|nr:alpha/beta hydrolase [Sporosarcina pasteurii]MDS9472965.1 alpha/beta hydrolase [Sporosarcina pasteurii]QBQ04481.1 alpha/beta hydrolase [Sporosarcina pasteurii]SUJ14572.1 Phospholipase ytpA [Sporosarcina pasteurii]
MWKWEAEGHPKAVVAIIHNAYEHHSRYAWFIQKLRSSNFHVVMGDLPGHGVQDGRTIHNEKFDTYVNYVKKLLDVGIVDGLPLFVIGHGLGATLMMRILQTEDIVCAGVVLSSPWLALEHQPAKFSTVLTKLSSSMKINHNIEIELLTRNTDIYLEAKNDKLYSSTVTAGWYRELQQFMKAVQQYNGTIHDIPVLMHTAGDDKIIDSQTAKAWLLRQQLTEFQYKEWPRLFHDLHQEPEREEVFLYTEAFMHTTLRSLGYVV